MKPLSYVLCTSYVFSYGLAEREQTAMGWYRARLEVVGRGIGPLRWDLDGPTFAKYLHKVVEQDRNGLCVYAEGLIESQPSLGGRAPNRSGPKAGSFAVSRI